MGRTSPNAVVVRPNNGRSCHNIPWIMERFIQPSSRCDDLAKVRKMWDKGENWWIQGLCDSANKVHSQFASLDRSSAEFALADIDSESAYQMWSFGRQRKPIYIFGGQVVPVINKLLTATLPRLNDTSYGAKEMTLPNIVRIEIGSTEEVTEGSSASNVLAPGAANVEENADTASEPPAVGQKVARKLLGGTIFRGKIVEVSLQPSNNFLHEQQLTADDHVCSSARVITRMLLSSLMERESKWMLKNCESQRNFSQQS